MYVLLMHFSVLYYGIGNIDFFICMNRKLLYTLSAESDESRMIFHPLFLHANTHPHEKYTWRSFMGKVNPLIFAQNKNTRQDFSTKL